MEQAALSPFAAWESFYVIVGSSAAALTGLQFVVIVLAAEVNSMGTGSGARAFGTPNIVHFCAVLLISAILSAPWPGLWSVALILGACGVVGVLYMLMVIRNARQQTEYKPVLEDWLWHFTLPLLTYGGLLAAAFALPRYPAEALFGIGGAAVLLLFAGIHNAWDSVTYIAFDQRRRPEGQAPESRKKRK